MDESPDTPEPPKRRNSLDTTSLRSNVKSLSSKSQIKDGIVAQLPMYGLIGLFGVVYGVTKSQELLPIIQMLVLALLSSMGYTHLNNLIKPD